MRRYTDEATAIGSCMIPKGVFVYVLFHHLHNNPALWDKPDQFLPDRWLQEDGNYRPEQSSKKSASSDSDTAAVQLTARAGAAADDPSAASSAYKKFLPFSDGPRNCPGQVRPIERLHVAAGRFQMLAGLLA